MKQYTPLLVLVTVLCAVAVITRLSPALPTRPPSRNPPPVAERNGDIKWAEGFPGGLLFFAHCFGAHVSDMGLPNDDLVPGLAAGFVGPGQPNQRKDTHLRYDAYVALLDGIASHGVWQLKGTLPFPDHGVPPGCVWITVHDGGEQYTSVVIRVDDPASQTIVRYVLEETVIGKLRQAMLQKAATHGPTVY